jgi:hypothetical protein
MFVCFLILASYMKILDAWVTNDWELSVLCSDGKQAVSVKRVGMCRFVGICLLGRIFV